MELSEINPKIYKPQTFSMIDTILNYLVSYIRFLWNYQLPKPCLFVEFGVDQKLGMCLRRPLSVFVFQNDPQQIFDDEKLGFCLRRPSALCFLKITPFCC